MFLQFKINTKIILLNCPDLGGAYNATTSKIDKMWYSRYLFEFDEPILYNYYLDGFIVRLTYLRSFDNPILITLKGTKDSTLIQYKILDRQIGTDIYVELLNGNYSVISKDTKMTNIKINKQFRIDNSTINALDSLIKKTNIFKQDPRIKVIGNDGSDWLLEIHSTSGYYYMYRWSPEKESGLRQIADYLIFLSKIDEKIY